MIELTLNRMVQTPNSTAGVLLHGTKWLGWIIEDGYHPVKVKGMTRIPPGRYKCQKATDTRFNHQYKQKYGHTWVMRILDVPNYSGIEIHIGNDMTDTDGCLLPNRMLVYEELRDVYKGVQSVNQYFDYYQYLDKLEDDEIFINIVENF